MALVPLSAHFQSLPPLPTIKLGPSGAASRVGGLVHALGPCGSPQWTLLWGWEFLLLPPKPPLVFSIRGLRLYFRMLELFVLSPVPPAAALLASCSFAYPAPQAATLLGPPAVTLLRVLSAGLPISAPPTGLDECFFFISLVVRLPYSSIFCQCWLFLFLNCCCLSFGCARRHSVSTYTSILVGSPKF